MLTTTRGECNINTPHEEAVLTQWIIDDNFHGFVPSELCSKPPDVRAFSVLDKCQIR